MNKRQETKILEAVFEDGQVPEKLSSAETVRLQEYQQIRHRLQLLKDVPEDQMSSERLRDAILNRGLGQTPASTGTRRYSYLVAPMASFALAFVAIFAMRGQKLPPAGTLIETGTPVAAISMSPITRVGPKDVVTKSTGKPSGTKSILASQNRRRPIKHREEMIEDYSNEVLVASNGTSGPVVNLVNHAVDVPAAPSDKLEPVTLGSGDVGSSGPIVVIEPATSTEEPARATETSSGAHTLVGG